MRRSAIALGILAVLALAPGCSHDGRYLRPPAPGATAPTTPPTSVASTLGSSVINPPVGSNGSAESTLRVTSTAFADGGEIPARYSCTGDNVSPPLEWTGVPADAVELAITMIDPDAPGGFVHWVLAGLDATATGLDEGAFPEGAVEARNDTSEFGWFGPCPPKGETHHYVLTLYALRTHLGLRPGVGGPDAIAAITASPADAAILTGLFTG